MIKREDALLYHSEGRKGKLEIAPTKPCLTQRDLSLAYSPGVAIPCMEIANNREDVFQYTARANLVAVISNGTAVLGLGNIGPYASKPVMEGKAVLFKKFADIDVFDLELDTTDPEEFVRTVKCLEPTFGGINIEDIKAPECFYIEKKLQEIMNIPVFHDDQHGTAIISGAALINALEIINKKIGEVRLVINGAGAAAIAGARHYIDLGVAKENIMMCDSRGVLSTAREDITGNPYKMEFAVETECVTLADAMKGADVFLGYSIGGVVSKEMLRSMTDNPIVFALANPDPEITYEDAKSARDDVIMATGRSDYPNQVNNVLGFPFIFRGALDVQATAINTAMKIAATKALVRLTREDVPDSVAKAYSVKRLEFGREYIITKPFDPRVIIWEASAVAEAAMETGVARIKIDIEEYKNKLESRMGKSRELVRTVINKARREPKRIVYPEGEHDKILRAANAVVEEGIARPVLIGNQQRIEEKIKELRLSLDGIDILTPISSVEKFKEYSNEYYQLRHRKGVTFDQAKGRMRLPIHFGAMMVRRGDAHGMVCGISHPYNEVLRPALQIVGTEEGISKIAGVYLVIIKNQIMLFADPTVNIDPDAETLAHIALLSAREAKRFNIEPRIAMLSFSNFGTSNHPLALKVKKAVELVQNMDPDLIIDGEMTADIAVDEKIREENFPFCKLQGTANVLIFPSLTSGNIAYRLMRRLGGAEIIGPISMGLNKPIHLLQMGISEVQDIVNMTAIAVVDSQDEAEKVTKKIAQQNQDKNSAKEASANTVWDFDK